MWFLQMRQKTTLIAVRNFRYNIHYFLFTLSASILPPAPSVASPIRQTAIFLWCVRLGNRFTHGVVLSLVSEDFRDDRRSLSSGVYFWPVGHLGCSLKPFTCWFFFQLALCLCSTQRILFSLSRIGEPAVVFGAADSCLQTTKATTQAPQLLLRSPRSILQSVFNIR